MFRIRAILVSVLLMTFAMVVLDDRLPAFAAPGVPVLRVLLLGDSYAAGNGARDVSASSDRTMDFYGPDLCFRSKANWAEQWAREYTLRTGVPVYLENHACSGATARSDFFQNRDETPTGQDPVGISVLVPYQHVEDLDDAYVRSFLEAHYPCATDSSDDSDRLAGGDPRSLVIRPWDPPVAGGPFYVTVTCHTDFYEQRQYADQSWDLVLLSLGGNDVNFGPIVKQCFIPIMRNDDACADSILSPDRVEQQI